MALTPAMVWILMSPKGPHVEGLIPNLWHYQEGWNFKRWGLTGGS